ncbi:MAG: PPC domain-containing protein [Phycisphaerae bacterium]|nr:PPC domain-containing protein [Phycisphaerae bacterium]
MDSSRLLAIACLSLLAVLPAARGQQNTPRIGYVYPAGGRQGQTFQVVLGGQYLDGAVGLCIGGGDIQAVVLSQTKPLTQRQFNELRDKMKELQERKSAGMKSAGPGGQGVSQDSNDASAEWTVEDEKMLAEIREKLSEGPPSRQANPAISETVTLSVTVGPDARPGRRELRLVTASGLSNPLVFCVGTLPEFREKAARAVVVPPNTAGQPYRRQAKVDPAEADMHISLPAVVNGQIMPGDVDRYRFAARKGQRLVVAASARELIPYLADAVPGWFQATVALCDDQGRELAYDDDYRFNPDPVLCCEIPEDGEYLIEIKDSIYRGRQDFVYRIAVGELPFVTSIFPLGGPAGARTSVDLQGWNLRTTRLIREPADAEERDRIVELDYSLPTSGNPPLFSVDTLPECVENESNDSLEMAQRIALPTIVNGRISADSDADVFRFDGRAGSAVVAEVTARRLGSPLDSVLRLTDNAGRHVASNDDQEDKGSGLITHHADSCLSVTLPTDGTYYLRLSDAQARGGDEYGYRLRISPPRPDFELRIVPSSINVRGGTTIPLTVYVLRRDGFDGDITLALKDAPSGYLLSGWAPGGQDKVQITLTVPSKPTEEPLSLSAEGRAVIDGREAVRPVVPADDMMQAFFYQHLVPARELRVAVSGQRMSKGDMRLVGSVPVRIPAGGTAPVRIGPAGRWFATTTQLEVSDPAEGIVVESVTPIREGVEIMLRSEADKVQPGLKGNLIVSAFSTKPPASAGEKTPQARRRVPAVTLPAIPFEIVSP